MSEKLNILWQWIWNRKNTINYQYDFKINHNFIMLHEREIPVTFSLSWSNRASWSGLVKKAKFLLLGSTQQRWNLCPSGPWPSSNWSDMSCEFRIWYIIRNKFNSWLIILIHYNWRDFVPLTGQKVGWVYGLLESFGDSHHFCLGRWGWINLLTGGLGV